MRYALAIFDFDGTLVDSFGTIAGVANRALESMGFAARTVADVRPLVGMELPVVMERLSGSAANADELAERVRAFWLEAKPPPFFSGIRELLDALHAAGTRLAVATNRRRPGLEDLLAEHGLRDRFDVLVGAECVDRRKPHPEPVERILSATGVASERSIVIGDTTLDIAMGRAAGTHTCGVTYGAHTREQLSAEEPTYLADATADLGSILL